jgi:putative membrane protein
MSYYTALSLLSLIFFPITFIPLLIRYLTLRYRFDDDGVGMSVGLLFRRETHLTYRRIQDIHVTRGLLQRWFGLATVEVQTASGSSAAELVIEGMLEPDRLRDWLYARMRGAHGVPETSTERVDADEPLALLREIRDELRRIGAERDEVRP